MKMHQFIAENLEPILADWEARATAVAPTAGEPDTRALRDFVQGVLENIAQDMASAQATEEAVQKPRGERPEQAPDVTGSAQRHAADRMKAGVTLAQLVGEYRALRSSVIRRWRGSLVEPGAAEMEELNRFNEAIDRSLTASIAWYYSRLEEARDLLNGVLAHDLRNPLYAIVLSADALLRAEDLDERCAAAAARVRNAGERMESMISDLLDFTRIRFGSGLPLSLEACSLGALCQDIVEETRLLNPGSVVRLETAGELSGAWDRTRIGQLLFNLLDNAARYARAGTPVDVRARDDGATVVLEVRNEGEPVAPGEQHAIFDPLRRAASSPPEDPGASRPGLGLYICRQVAEAHGGSIEMTSSTADGTVFTVRLPRRPPSGVRDGP